MTGDQSLCQSLRPASPGHDGASAGCAFPSRCLSPAPASGRAVGGPSPPAAAGAACPGLPVALPRLRLLPKAERLPFSVT